MERRVFPIIVMFLGILATPLFAQTSARPQVRPHDDDCLRAAIVRNPEVLVAGDHFVMAVGLQNGCRHIAQVHVDIYLAQDDFRVQIGSGYVELDGPRPEFLYLRPLVPRHLESGRYSLVMVADPRGGEMVLDRTGVFVRNGNVDPVRPDDIRPDPIGGEITGKVSRMGGNLIQVITQDGRSKTLVIDRRTVIENEYGRPSRLHVGDWVHVEFTGRHADVITVRSH
ncbi:MAG: hypothetical protein VB855_12115 [Pirellulaceae bacterium]